MKKKLHPQKKLFTCFLLLLIAQNNCAFSQSNKGVSLCGKEVRTITYFKIDSNEVSWDINTKTYFKMDSTENRWARNQKNIDKEKLVGCLLEGIKNGKLQVYDAVFNEDSNITESVKSKLIRLDTVVVEQGGTMFPTLMKTELTAEDIDHVAFKEDWKVDAEKLKMEKKVTAICLFKISKNELGEVRGYEPLGWVKLN